MQAGVQAGVLARGIKNKAVRVYYWDNFALNIVCKVLNHFFGGTQQKKIASRGFMSDFAEIWKLVNTVA